MFTTELVSLKNKILLPPGAGEVGFTCSYRRREPAGPDSHAAGSAESRRRQIHVQPALPGASGAGCTCVVFCRELRLIHLDDVSFRMRDEFRRIEALDRTDSACIFTGA